MQVATAPSPAATSQRLKGVFSPVLTPFNADYTPDAARFAKHCKWLTAQDVGLAIFGTNSEANSLGLAEKRKLMEQLLAAGIPAARMMPGTGCCALPETIELTKAAVAAGCGGVLMLPPFYYKNVSDEGLYRAFSTVIDSVADDRLRVYLYHIPPVAQVPITLGLVERLLKKYPKAIAGMKDSSGDWNNTQAFISQFGAQGFDVFCGSENFLLQTMRAGGAGCITATGNVNPAAIVDLYRNWQAGDADARQKGLDGTRAAFAQFVMIPAMKAAIAWKSGRAEWATVRPPLVELNAEQRTKLQASLDACGFDIPNAASLA
jgi:4-hydroxy-tetrahydrodipicolinate synthase